MPYAPLKFENYTLTIGSVEHGIECSAVTLTPRATTMTFKAGGVAPTDYKDVELDWTLDLTYGQDWATPTSLSRILLENAGQVGSGWVFVPKHGDGPTFTVDVLQVPGAAGGTGRQHATATVSLEVIGQPDFAAA